MDFRPAFGQIPLEVAFGKHGCAMSAVSKPRIPLAAGVTAVGLFATLLSGCVGAGLDETLSSAAVNAQSQQCLARAMYFESNRSSREGMLAVGTVVMNRVKSPDYPGSVCGVVGQDGQFASGVMTRGMGPGRELAMAAAGEVLSGKRYAPVGHARFFHTAGYSYPYHNMNYKAVVGGNAFYEKVSPRAHPQFDFVTQKEVVAAQRAGISTATAYGDEEGGDAVTSGGTAGRTRSPFLALWQGMTTGEAGAASAGSNRARSARVVSTHGSEAQPGPLPGVMPSQ